MKTFIRILKLIFERERRSLRRSQFELVLEKQILQRIGGSIFTHELWMKLFLESEILLLRFHS